MIPIQLQPLANHLWQSTLFAAAAGLLTLVLRNNRAQTRYRLWLVASVKFLIPFSLLVDVGGYFGRHTAPTIASLRVSSVIEQVSQPFAVPDPIATAQVATQASSVNWIPTLLSIVWAIGFVALLFSWWRRWRGLHAALRTASPLDLNIGIETMTSPSFAEPGVFGVRRPVLLLPSGVTERLTLPQLEAIVAHEMCHVRRRDNLATAIHMGVEAVFWFHPLVWWLGARLMQERERACDEEVLLLGSEPEAYAEGILKICELYLESPLPCVSGVTGANLKRRIEEVMSNRIGLRLSLAKRIVLVAAGVTAITAPIVVGMLNAPAIQAQPPQGVAQSVPGLAAKFEVASVKPCRAVQGGGRGGGGTGRADTSPGKIHLHCWSVFQLINIAYVKNGDPLINDSSQPLDTNRIRGGPTWMYSALYEIDAKAEGTPDRRVMMGSMLQALLKDRFHLKIHREREEAPIYALTVTKTGLKLQPMAEGGCITAFDPTKHRSFFGAGEKLPCGMIQDLGTGPGGTKLTLDAAGVGLGRIAGALSALLDRNVVDKTGVTGIFNVHLEFARDENTRPLPVGTPLPEPADVSSAPSIFTALERLGLKLVAEKGPRGFIVIDHVERPSEN